MACAGQSVRAHAAIVSLLVSSLSCGRESDDDVAWSYVCVVDDIGSLHAARDGGIDDDGAHQVAYVCRLATRCVYADAHVSEFLEKLICTVDDGRDDFAWDEVLVAPDGGGDKDVIDSAYAKQVVGIHHDSVLCDAFPHTQVARLFPIHICQRRLGSRSIGVHDVAILGVASQNVGDYLAERLREYPFIDVLYGCMHVFFGSRDTTLHVSVCSIHDLGLL